MEACSPPRQHLRRHAPPPPPPPPPQPTLGPTHHQPARRRPYWRRVGFAPLARTLSHVRRRYRRTSLSFSLSLSLFVSVHGDSLTPTPTPEPCFTSLPPPHHLCPRPSPSLRSGARRCCSSRASPDSSLHCRPASEVVTDSPSSSLPAPFPFFLRECVACFCPAQPLIPSVRPRLGVEQIRVSTNERSQCSFRWGRFSSPTVCSLVLPLRVI